MAPAPPPSNAAADAPASTLQSDSATAWSIIRSSPWYHQLFCALVLIQILYLVAERFVLLSFVDFSDQIATVEAAYFLGIITLSVLFAAYYGIHAVVAVSYMELAAFRIVTFWLACRLILDYFNSSDECEGTVAANTCLGFMILAIVFNIATFAITVWMLNDLKWKRFKALGGDVLTQQMYRRYELFSAVRKVDLQFSLITLYTGLVFCIYSISLRTAQFSLGVNAVLVVVEAFWEVLGDRAVKQEQEFYMYAFWCLSVFQPMYVLNVMVDAWTDNEILALASSSVRITIGVFALLGVLNRIATVVCSILLYRNFGENYRGLRRIFEGGRLSKFQRVRGPVQFVETRRKGDAVATTAVGMRGPEGSTSVPNPLQGLGLGASPGSISTSSSDGGGAALWVARASSSGGGGTADAGAFLAPGGGGAEDLTPLSLLPTERGDASPTPGALLQQQQQQQQQPEHVAVGLGSSVEEWRQSPARGGAGRVQQQPRR